MEIIETEKATYDPDLPHAYMPGTANECQLCMRPRREDLHQIPPLQRQQASEDLLGRELGS